MRKSILPVLFIINSLLLFNSCCDTTSPEETGLFPDPNFELAIRQSLGKPDGEITKEDLLTLFEIYVWDYSFEGQIQNISGIEYCINLENASFYGSDINDLSPIMNLEFLRSIDFGQNDLTSIHTLKGPINLNHLWLNGNFQLINLNGIENTPNLRGLNLSENQISNFAALKGMSRIESLQISKNDLFELKAFPTLNNLKYLDLSDNNLSDLNELSKQPRLNSIYLYNNNISDISNLAEFVSLDWVGLANNRIYDIGPLENLSNIRGLSLEHNLISDISALSNLKQLEYLYLFNNAISILDPIKGLTNLVNLQINNIHNLNIEILSDLNELQSLTVDNCNITDLSVLSEFKLYEFSAAYNNITDITPLENMDIGWLVLNNNNISDISALANIDVYHLELSNNNISDIKPLVDNKYLYSSEYNWKEVYLNGNPLSAQSINEYIPILEAREIEVYWGDKYPSKTKIQNQFSKKYVHPITGEMTDEFVIPIEN